jgi:hypothetical protein
MDFGRRPPGGDMAMNGSILNRLTHGRGYSWAEMGVMVEGLAILRDQGKLEPTVKRTEPVSLRWVYDSGQMINQVTRCLDAYYSEVAKPGAEAGRSGGPDSGSLIHFTQLELKAMWVVLSNKPIFTGDLALLAAADTALEKVYRAERGM